MGGHTDSSGKANCQEMPISQEPALLSRAMSRLIRLCWNGTLYDNSSGSQCLIKSRQWMPFAHP